MKLRIWFLLTLAGSYPLLSAGNANGLIFGADIGAPFNFKKVEPRNKVIDMASGDGDGDEVGDEVGDSPLPNTYPIAGSGDGDDTEVEEVEGSGGDELPVSHTKNQKCSGVHCWCVDIDGKEIAETRTIYASPPDCSLYDTKSTSLASVHRLGKSTPTSAKPESSTMKSSSPSKEIEQPDTVTETTEKMVEISEDWIFPEEVEKLGGGKLPPVVIVEPSTVKPTVEINNKITAGIPPPKVVPDEAVEEETNVIGGDNSAPVAAAAVIRKDTEARGGLMLKHPGILAAVIGGGVVGLLCAILLIMFIVYRMRKKDEGSYPLNDSKAMSKDYAYAKAPSQEFYA